MPYSCFIDGCVQNSEEQGFFKPPKTKLEDWADKIPKKGLSKNSRLCWRHFDTHLVERGKMVGNVFVPQKKWRLVRGAEPTLKLDTIATMQPLSGSKRRQPLQLQNTNSEVLVKKKTFPSRLKPMNSIIGAPGYQTLMKPPSSKELNVNKENVGSILSKPVHSDIVVADTVEESESSSRLLDSNKLQHAVDENGLAYELIEPAGSQEEEGHLSEMDLPYEMDDWALENQRAFDYCQSTNGLSVEDVPPSTASSEPAVEETEDFQESLTDKEFSAGMHQEILSQSTTHQPNDCLDFPIDRPSTSVDVSTDALDSEPPFEQSTESLDCPIDELFFHE